MDMEPNMQPRPNGGYQQQTSAPQPENPQQGWSQPPIKMCIRDSPRPFK